MPELVAQLRATLAPPLIMLVHLTGFLATSADCSLKNEKNHVAFLMFQLSASSLIFLIICPLPPFSHKELENDNVKT